MDGDTGGRRVGMEEERAGHLKTRTHQRELWEHAVLTDCFVALGFDTRGAWKFLVAFGVLCGLLVEFLVVPCWFLVGFLRASCWSLVGSLWFFCWELRERVGKSWKELERVGTSWKELERVGRVGNEQTLRFSLFLEAL